MIVFIVPAPMFLGVWLQTKFSLGYHKMTILTDQKILIPPVHNNFGRTGPPNNFSCPFYLYLYFPVVASPRGS